jgi:hypothetical protein
MAAGESTLPHVDEHSTAVAARPEATWEAIQAVVEGSFARPGAARTARLLGCADIAASGPRPLAAGSAFPGFHVESADPPRELVLRGRHRFSDYALIFRLDEEDGARTIVRAETRAAFPGLTGRTYRALVIGSRGHVLATRRLLGAIRHRAERA